MLFRIIDLETTGLDPTKDGIVEIASVDMKEDGPTFNPMQELIDPKIHIPAETSAIHHIIDEDVMGAATIDQVLSKYRGPEGTIHVAHNADFERSFLTSMGPMKWLCTYKASHRVWPDFTSHSNQFLRYHLKLNVMRDVGMPHRALPDCIVTAELMKVLLQHATLEDMLRWTNLPVLKINCTFGKHAGQKWSDVPKDYLQWIVKNGTFDEDTTYTAKVNLGLIEHV